MPTIAQLPTAGSISADDEVPISQAGVVRAVSIGTLLASVQSEISVASPSLLGRTSLGSGSPEQVDVGTGMVIAGRTLVANGLDHAGFPLLPSLAGDPDLVISSQGSPMLMQASLLRGLFSAGENVAIDPNGVISSAAGTVSGTIDVVGPIAALPLVASLASQDLVAVSQTGSNCAISYSNLLDGITIDQAPAAAPAGDSDTLWVAQGSSTMASQTLAAVWIWLASKLPTYKTQTIEITTITNLDTTIHNGRLLICSQPVTLTPLTSNMGSGFHCTVINASAGNVTLGSAFVSSSGNLVLTPWQSATLSCASYSAGTIAFAAMPSAAAAIVVPGQVGGLATSGVASATITVSWQAPSSGGTASSYIVQYRPSGASSWSGTGSVGGVSSYQLTGLQPATSYDITVAAQNSAGIGAPSAILTVSTSSVTQTTVPPPVTGLAASPTSATAIQLTWSAQTGASAATSFTVEYRATGSSTWTSTIPGLTGTTSAISGLQAATSYDFAVIGVNAIGAGAVSSIVSAATPAAAQSVTSITWNVAPGGTYTRGSGAIGVNAQVTPGSSPIQFGFSLSASSRPTGWTAAILVNTNLWGAYVATPSTAGTWYAWAEGLDGSAATVSATPFIVQ
jgi:hypothetical protein